MGSREPAPSPVPCILCTWVTRNTIELLSRGKQYWVSAGIPGNIQEGSSTLYRGVMSSQEKQTREGPRRLERGEHKMLIRQGWGGGVEAREVLRDMPRPLGVTRSEKTRSDVCALGVVTRSGSVCSEQ